MDVGKKVITLKFKGDGGQKVKQELPHTDKRKALEKAARVCEKGFEV